MPVEIRELVIRAIISDQQSGRNVRKNRQTDDETERALLVQECVREVLKQLEKKLER